MYIPSSFKFEQYAEQISFMKRYSFATIITYDGTLPLATHLPMIIDERADGLYLLSHFSSVNQQTHHLQNQESLVIFTEPHAYISPKHYDKVQSVPTWDYITLHVYGSIQILPTEEQKISILEKTIEFYEKDYMEQWLSLSEKYKKGMMQGIVAFEMKVNSIQGQKKLSQNKTTEERNRIIHTLEQSENSVEKDLAEYIRKL